MNLSHIIQSLYYEPMLITPSAHAALRKIVESKLAGTTMEKVASDDTDIFGNPLPKLEIQNNIAIVPVNGPIIKRSTMLTRVCGLCSTVGITEDINTALANPSVDTLILNINSPGGTVTGVPELAEYIRDNVSKRVRTIAYTDELAASAAFYIACGCSEIYSSPTADILSIGVYNYFLDVSQAYEDMGVKVELFKSGELKAIGLPGVSLTNEQKTYLQQDVDKIGNMFRNFVREGYPNITDDMMRGQVMMGYEVVEKNGITGLASSLTDVIEHYRK